MTMRTIFIRGCAFLLPLLFVFAAAPAYAATISLSPTSMSVTAGETVSLQVIVNAQGTRVVSSQFQLSYPANLLEPVTFAFAPNWVQTFDIGTNIMANGTVVQAGGYPTGFNGIQTMGTLTFQAKKAGTAVIATQNQNSYIFETDGGNLFTGPLSAAQVYIAPGTNSVSAPAITVSDSAQSSTSQTMAGDASSLFPQVWLWIACAAVVVCVFSIVWHLYTRKKKRRRK
jgi:hypothetical protein